MSRLIDADALKIDYYTVGSATSNMPCYYYVSKEQIDSAPTIEAEPVRRGKWKHIPEEPFAGYYVCSVCNEQAEVSSFEEWLLTDYCPFCGARLESEVEE